MATRRPSRPGPVVFLDGLMWLLVFWLGGELVVRTLDLPLPGAVLGMLALFVALQVRDPGRSSALLRASEGLLAHLQLLFVPAGVGIVMVLGAVGRDAVPLVGAMVVSWAVGLLAIGWLVTLLLPRRGRAAGGGER